MSINKKHKLIILIATVAMVFCVLTAVLVLLSCKTDKGNSSSSLVDSSDSSSSSSGETNKSTQLLKPKNVRVENGILKWNTVKNADYYIISYLDEEIEVETTEFSVVDIFNAHGEIYIRVSAVSRQNNVKTSDFAGCYLTNENVGGGDWAPGLEFALLPDDKGYSVSAEDAFKCSGVITIPSTHNGKPVTMIADKAFYAVEITISGKMLYNPNITAFEIPDTITEIGEEAFCGCGGVKEMVIPESCVIIGEGAFAQMYGLETITFPSVLKDLPPSVLAVCNKLKSVNLPQNLASIGSGAFNPCKDLETITLPDSLVSIGKKAFSKCTALKNIKFPANLKLIDDRAFYSCAALTDVDLSGGVETIGNEVFLECGALSNIVLPNNLLTIGKKAFEKCTALKTVDIPDSVTDIGSGAFYLANALEKVKLPTGLKRIENSLFYKCTQLKEIVFPECEIEYIGGLAFYSTQWLLDKPDGFIMVDDYLVGYSGEMPNGIIDAYPSNMKYIAGGAFADNEYLTEITLPQDMATVAYAMFKNCRSLQTVVLPEGLRTLEGNVFENCTSLKTIEIPSSVNSIGLSCFAGSGVENVVLPDVLERLEFKTFYNCKSLKNVKLSMLLKEIGQNCFSKSGLEFIEFPNLLETIDSSAFAQCEALIGVKFNKNLKNVQYSAFAKCVRLAEVINESEIDTKTLLADARGAIVDSLLVNKDGGTSQIEKENGFYVFERNGEKILISPIDKNIENAVLPEGVAVIRRNAFYNCTNLKSVYYPSALKTVEKDAFYNCKAIKEIKADEASTLCTIDYPDALVFGSYPNLIIKGEKVTELVIPASVNVIKSRVFSYFLSIKSVKFEGSVRLEKGALWSVEKVYIKNKELLSGNINESGLLSRSARTLLIEEDTSKVYFYGTESRWAQLSDERKAPASGKTVYFYSETQPTASGNYWHFDDNGAIAVW